MPDFLDIFIIIIGLISSGLFYYFGTEKLYRFYFGIIMGFLLFLVFNLQVKLFEIGGGVIGGWEEFLVSNKDFILGLFSFLIPVFGILFTVIDSDLKSNKLFSLLFGFFLPLFILGIFGYILLNSAVNLSFLENIFGFFTNSFIFTFLQDSPKIIFFLLLLIIFWKYIFILIVALLKHFAELILYEIRELSGKKEENKTYD
ncbi:MAG: hypothetical protein Q9M94_06985 [Candidatus Gracilibacteria bacterium]|nr:hypothetical protein [Candidatus Gracilibacteria bacterium]